MVSSCAGKKGKQQLDQAVEHQRMCLCTGQGANKEKEQLDLVKKTVLLKWPIKPDSNAEKEWKSCIAAIDEANTRLNR